MNALDWDHNAYYHRLLLRHLPRPCNRVLDVGCGAGAFAVELAKRAEHVGKHSPGGRRVMDGAVLGRFYGEMACAGGCQGLPSMSWCRTWRAPWPCLRAVSM